MSQLATRKYPKPVPVVVPVSPPIMPPPPAKKRAKPHTFAYGRPVLAVPAALGDWYWQNGTAAFEMWEKNGDGNLIRSKRVVALRRKMILDLCITPDAPNRISPGDIARFVGVNHSILFSMASDVRDALPTQSDRVETSEKIL